jgi:DNA-binding CsgD family transcriptional regulator
VNQQNATNSWEEFSYYFEKVHPSFYQNLEKQCPELTTKEKRLCAFLALGLSSKEISAITFKEVRSVESARNRLRKKLGVNQEDNLTDFLHTAVSINNDN